MSTETEKKIFTAIESGDDALLRAALDDHPNVNIIDENLMTPLQHAAYKGNKDMVQILLDYVSSCNTLSKPINLCSFQGADPNLCKHQHNYTALHFAGLSGNFEVCLALLVAGARPDVTNAVNRTASQMAAFVGHHKCVAIINNYVQKSNVDYYTVAHGLHTKPYLPPYLAESFHKLIIQVNMHPVKVALNMHSFIGIFEHLSEVKTVLELMSEKEMKNEGSNEVMAFKFFYLSYVAGELVNIQAKQNAKKQEDKKNETLQVFCKNILKPGKDGSLQFMDAFLRECVKKFPFRECTLLRQIVSTLTGKDPPTALSIVTFAINGQRGFVDDAVDCYTCGEEKPTKKCSKCKVAQYCDKNCQKLHWHWHKKVCASLVQDSSSSKDKKEVAVDSSELSSEIQNLLISN